MTSRSCRRGSEKRSTADRPVPPSRLQRTTGQYKAVYRCMVRLIVSPPAWMGKHSQPQIGPHHSFSGGDVPSDVLSPLCSDALGECLPALPLAIAATAAPRRAGITTWSWLHLRALLLLLLLHPRANQEPPGRKFFVWPTLSASPVSFFPSGWAALRPPPGAAVRTMQQLV